MPTKNKNKTDEVVKEREIMKKLLIILLLMLISTSTSAKAGWNVTRTFKDVVPLSIILDNYGNIVILFNDGGSFRQEKKYFPKGSLTDFRVNEPGSLMHYFDEKGKWNNKYQWFPSDKKEPLPKKIDKKTPVKKIDKKTLVKKVETSWIDVRRQLPKKDEVVLVKYKDGLLTTAYINNDGEWKLNTDRDKLFGGDTIITIKEWKSIN